jgi:pectate lyase
MGTSHQRSNLVGKAGTETIRGFATISATYIYGGTLGGATVHATTFTSNAVTATTANIVTGNITHANVTGTLTMSASTDHIQLGDHQYIIFGEQTTQAGVEAAATAVDASCRGSLYISRAGHLWIMTADDTAASLTQS